MISQTIAVDWRHLRPVVQREHFQLRHHLRVIGEIVAKLAIFFAIYRRLYFPINRLSARICPSIVFNKSALVTPASRLSTVFKA